MIVGERHVLGFQTRSLVPNRIALRSLDAAIRSAYLRPEDRTHEIAAPYGCEDVSSPRRPPDTVEYLRLLQHDVCTAG